MTPVISKIEFNNIPDSNNNIIVVDFKDIQPLLHKDSVNVTDIIKRMEKRSIDEVQLCVDKPYSNYLIENDNLKFLINIDKETWKQLVDNSYITLIGSYELQVKSGGLMQHVEYYDTPYRISITKLLNLLSMTGCYVTTVYMKIFIFMFNAVNTVKFTIYEQANAVCIEIKFSLTDGDTQ